MSVGEQFKQTPEKRIRRALVEAAETHLESLTSSIEYFVTLLPLLAPEFHARHSGDEEIHIVQLRASGSDLHWGAFVA